MEKSLALKPADAPLAVALVHGNLHVGGANALPLFEGIEQLLADPTGKQFGGGVRHRQQHAIGRRKNPTPVAVGDLNLVAAACNGDRWVLGRQQHPMVEPVDNRLQRVSQGDKVDDVLVFVERPTHFGGDVIVVPMQRFAGIAS